jgi:hypothetical protein
MACQRPSASHDMLAEPCWLNHGMPRQPCISWHAGRAPGQLHAGRGWQARSRGHETCGCAPKISSSLAKADLVQMMKRPRWPPGASCARGSEAKVRPHMTTTHASHNMNWPFSGLIHPICPFPPSQMHVNARGAATLIIHNANICRGPCGMWSLLGCTGDRRTEQQHQQVKPAPTSTRAGVTSAAAEDGAQGMRA